MTRPVSARPVSARPVTARLTQHGLQRLVSTRPVPSSRWRPPPTKAPRWRPPATAPRRRDGGAAVVDFVLVGALVTFVFLGVVQLTTVLHVRNTLIDCATEGARFGALAGSDLDSGAQRTRELIEADLSATYAEDVVAGRAEVDGLETVEVRVRAPLPVIGLLGVGRVVTVSGHAVAEPP